MTTTETATRTSEGVEYFNGGETFVFTGKRDRLATHIVTCDRDGERLVFSMNSRRDLAEKSRNQAAKWGRVDPRVITVKETN